MLEAFNARILQSELPADGISTLLALSANSLIQKLDRSEGLPAGDKFGGIIEIESMKSVKEEIQLERWTLQELLDEKGSALSTTLNPRRLDDMITLIARGIAAVIVNSNRDEIFALLATPAFDAKRNNDIAACERAKVPFTEEEFATSELMMYIIQKFFVPKFGKLV